MSLEIRRANAGDWPAIARLLLETQLPEAGARDHLHRFLIALRDNRTIGCIGLEVYSKIALLRSVAVVSDESGKGIGKSLVAAQLDQAKQCGVATIYLLTTTAAAYFEALGFSERQRQDAPAALQDSIEFQGACPASAAFMGLAI